MNAAQVNAALAKAYCEPKHALFYEVPARPDSTGRKIDALAVALWRSLNFELTGFEVKVSRSDWLREIKDPSKGEALFKFCHQFYVVTPKRVGRERPIIHEEEVPANWGWIEVTEDKIHTRKKAPKLDPEPMTQGLMVAILRREARSAKAMAREEAQRALAKEHQRIDERVKARVDNQLNTLKQSLKAHKEAVEKFTAETGIPLNQTAHRLSNVRPERLAKALRFVEEMGLVEGNWSGVDLRRRVKSMRDDLDRVDAAIDRFTEREPEDLI